MRNQSSEQQVETEIVNVMIIGSGFGGAVAAHRLSEKGISATMLERGKRWPVTDAEDTFSSLQEPDGRSAWLSERAILGPPKPIEKFIGVLELIAGRGISTLNGAGYGGGSLIYAGALLQPKRNMFELAFGNSVDYLEMNDTYYPRAREVLSPSQIPQNILAKPDYAASKMWRSLGERANLKSELINLGLSWKIVQDELKGERKESVIKGDFWYGNNSNAKLSLDKNYLKMAESTGYLDVRTQHDVTEIEAGTEPGCYIVHANQIDVDGSVISKKKFLVNKLILAAGSMATSKLLVRSKAKGLLPDLNDQVGKNWGNNGDFFSSISGMRPSIKPNRGGTVTVAIDDEQNSITPTCVECYADWALEGKHGEISSIGMAPAPALGTFSYDEQRDDVVLTWPHDDPEILKIIAAGEETYQKLSAHWGLGKNSVRKVRSGHIALPDDVSAGITAHPLGGVVIDKATDNVGMVKNYTGLYVMDSALIPGHTGCVNPALTIAALAERNIEKIIERDF